MENTKMKMKRWRLKINLIEAEHKHKHQIIYREPGLEPLLYVLQGPEVGTRPEYPYWYCRCGVHVPDLL
jgi:hypothetical protein